MREDIVVGMDIGTTKIGTVVGRLDQSGRLEIIGVGSCPSRGLKKAVVVDIEEAVASISESVERAERRAGIEIRSVWAGITGHHITCVNTRAVVAVTSEDHVIHEEHRRRVIEEALSATQIPDDHRIIHRIPRQFIIDGQDGVQHPVGMFGSKLEVELHVVTGVDSFVHNLEECIRRAGLELERLCLEPIAASEAVVTQAEKNLGVALIDIGGGTTDIAIFVDGSIAFSRALPIGGNHVTRDISIGLRTPFEEAEQLKHQHGSAIASLVNEAEVIEVTTVGDGMVRKLPRLILAQVIEPRMRELLRMVNRSLRSSDFFDSLAAGAVLTGGGSLLPGTQDLAGEMLDMPVRIGSPTLRLGITEELHNPMYSTAVGLVQLAAQSRLMARRKPSVDAHRMHPIAERFLHWARGLWKRW